MVKKVKFLLIPTMGQVLGFPWVPAVTEANQGPLRPNATLQDHMANSMVRPLEPFNTHHLHPHYLYEITHSLTCSHYELQPHTFPTRPHLYLPTSMILAKLCPLPSVLLILLQPLFRARLTPIPTSSRACPDPPPRSTQMPSLTLIILPSSGKPCVRCPAPIS